MRVRGAKAAFTLAEVLITLVIIGVVAALTMPSLIANYKKKLYSTKLKEGYSILSQAIKLSEIDNGPVETWRWNTMDNYDKDGKLDYVKLATNCNNFFNKYLGPYLKYTYSEGSEKKGRTYRLANGLYMDLWNGTKMDIYLKVVSTKKEKGGGKDVHYFTITPGKGLEVGESTSTDREELKRACVTNFIYCTRLLYVDNWEFKDDYPIKF